MRKYRIAAGTTFLAVGLMALLSFAPSAIAGDGTGGPGGGGTTGGGTTVGCNPADATCFDGAYQFVNLSGDYSYTPTQGKPLPPPPCLWNAIGNATTGSEFILVFARNLVHVEPQQEAAELLKMLAPVLGQAQDLLGQAQSKPPGPAGTWYQEEPDPAVSPQESASCDTTVLFDWVVPGATPPVRALPAVDLAAYAFDHMVLPKPAVTTSPAATGYVNFATYVWTTWATSGYTGSRARAVTATLGGRSVTVWAQPTVKIEVNGPGTAYTSGCTIDGSASPLGKAPDSQAGVPPDCGALWTATDAGATITATITWTVTYYDGGPNGPAGKQLAVIGTNGTSPALPINSIQAVN